MIAFKTLMVVALLTGSTSETVQGKASETLTATKARAVKALGSQVDPRVVTSDRCHKNPIFPVECSRPRRIPTATATFGPKLNAGSYYITGYDTGQFTATGTQARVGEVAVDPGWPIPMGAYVRIAGLSDLGLPICYHAEDTGGAVGPYHIDVFVPNDTVANEITGMRYAWWSYKPCWTQ